jgi:hypothetical protein
MFFSSLPHKYEALFSHTSVMYGMSQKSEKLHATTKSTYKMFLATKYALNATALC